MGILKRFFKGVLMTATLLASMTFADAQTGVAPNVRFLETDQALPLGLWRIRLDGDVFSIQKNTSASNNFSTVTTAISIAANGDVTIPNDFFVTGSATVTVDTSITGSLTTQGQIIVDFDSTEALLIRKNGDAGDIFRVDTSTDPPHIYIERQSDGAFDLDIRFRRARASATTVVSGDSIAGIDWFGHDGTSFIEGAGIVGFSEGTIATTRVPMRLVFFTGTDAAPTVITEALRLDSAQKATFAGAVSIAGATDIQAATVIDVTNTEVFLVRKDADGGDVFAVNTTLGNVTITSQSDTNGLLITGSANNVVMKMQSTGAGGAIWRQGSTGGGSGFGQGIWFIDKNDNLPRIILENTLTRFEQSPVVIDITNTEAFLVRQNADGGDVFIIDATNDEVEIPTGVLILGLGNTAAQDSIIIDGTDRVGDGQTDSGAIIMTGLAFESATPHDADWKTFVDVTSNTGDSTWTLQERIDGAAFVTHISVKQDGGFTAVAESPHSFGGVTTEENYFQVTGQFIPTQPGGEINAFMINVGLIGGAGDTSGLFLSNIDGGIQTQTATENITAIAALQINEPDITDNLTGGGVIQSAAALIVTDAPVGIASGANFVNAAILIGTLQTGTYDAIVIDQIDRVGAGQDDSGKIVLTGVSHDGAPHDADWQQFVDVTSNAGASTWRLQTRIDAAGFVDKLTVTDAGALTVDSLTLSTTPLAVGSGGIGVGTLTDGGILLGSGTSALTALARGTAGQMLIGSTSGDPVMGTLAGTANEVAITTGDGTLAVGLATNITVAGTLGVTGNTDFQGTALIDITSTEALLIRKNSDGGDVFAIDSTNARMRLGVPGSDGQDEAITEASVVTGGNFEVLDQGTLGAETFTDGGFPSTTNWAGAGEWSDTITGAAIFTFSATGNGTMTQTATQRVTDNEGSNARWYSLTYTTSSVVDAGGLTLSITNSFAATAVPLSTADGTYSVIFQSHATTADTADFVFDITGASGSDVLTLDDVILKEVTGGNIVLAGKITGGGPNGIAVSGGGTVVTFEAALGTVGATETVDWRDGNHQAATLDENLTFTFIDPDGPGGFTMKLTQDVTGTNTVAWPASVLWEAGVAPTITVTGDAVDLVSFYFDGTSYFGSVLQDMQ